MQKILIYYSNEMSYFYNIPSIDNTTGNPKLICRTISELCTAELSRRDVTENFVFASCRTYRPRSTNTWINVRIYTLHRCVDILPEITWRYLVPVARHRSCEPLPEASQAHTESVLHIKCNS